MLWKQHKFVLLTFVFAVSFLLLALPTVSKAYGLVPCGSNGERPCNVEDIFVLIARVTNWLIAFAGLFAVYEVISGAFWLVVTMGNEEAITKHKAQVTSAILGLCLVFMAYMFINTVVNLLLTRDLVTTNPNGAYCKLDLTNPLTYLSIDPSKCTSLPDAALHSPSK